MKKARPEEIGEIFGEHFTVADRMDAIIRKIRTVKRLAFSALFGADPTRYEIICTFLGLLELIRLRQIGVVQDERFSDILITEAADAESEEMATDADEGKGI